MSISVVRWYLPVRCEAWRRRAREAMVISERCRALAYNDRARSDVLISRSATVPGL